MFLLCLLTLLFAVYFPLNNVWCVWSIALRSSFLSFPAFFSLFVPWLQQVCIWNRFFITKIIIFERFCGWNEDWEINQLQIVNDHITLNPFSFFIKSIVFVSTLYLPFCWFVIHFILNNVWNIFFFSKIIIFERFWRRNEDWAITWELRQILIPFHITQNSWRHLRVEKSLKSEARSTCCLALGHTFSSPLIDQEISH